MKKIGFPLICLLAMLSCQKELSIEEGGGNSGQPIIGDNCKMNQIITADSLTGLGLFSIYTRFPLFGDADKVEVYDSISGTMEYQTNLVYKGDTVRVTPTEFFLLDANKRVRGFQSIDSSGGSADTLRYVYNYDANGYLQNKELFLTGIPLPFIRFTYVWSGQNLVAIDGFIAAPGITQKVLTATLEYESTATAKNFIHVLPDGFETSLYIMGLDLGKKSRNLVKKIVVTEYDDIGALDEVYTTTYGNYVFSADGYLLEWYSKGEEAGGTPFQSGRSIFKYFCN